MARIGIHLKPWCCLGVLWMRPQGRRILAIHVIPFVGVHIEFGERPTSAPALLQQAYGDDVIDSVRRQSVLGRLFGKTKFIARIPSAESRKAAMRDQIERIDRGIYVRNLRRGMERAMREEKDEGEKTER